MPPSPSSTTFSPALLGGFGVASTHRGQRAGQRRPAPASTPGVGERQRGHRLLLRRHDPLERRVPRLVDLLAHAHDRRQLGRQHRHAVVGLPPHRHRAALDRRPRGRGSAPAGPAPRRPSPAPRPTARPTPRCPRAPGQRPRRCRSHRPAPAPCRPRPSRPGPRRTGAPPCRAPIDSALRIASVARSGPIDTTVTSPPCASLSCSASSTARSLISSSTASEASRSRAPSAPQPALGVGVGHLLAQNDDVHRIPSTSPVLPAGIAEDSSREG